MNVQSLICTAAAYNFTAIIVGAEKIHIQDMNLPVEVPSPLKFDSLEILQAFLAEGAVPIVGIEIMSEAKSILDHPSPFTNAIALMPGNEGKPEES